MNKIKNVIGDGAFYAQPVEGKTVKLPFGDSWVELMKNVKRGALTNLKSFEAKGAPYDPMRIVVTPFVKDMKLEYSRTYAYMYPVAGLIFALCCFGEENRNPPNRALKINLLPK